MSKNTILVASAGTSSPFDLYTAETNSDISIDTVFSKASDSDQVLQSAGNIALFGREEDVAILVGGGDQRLAVDYYTDLLENMPQDRKFSVMLDPNGSITYAAVIATLLLRNKEDFARNKTLIIGGGRVGGALATMITMSGGLVTLASKSQVDLDHASTLVQRFGADNGFSTTTEKDPLNSGNYKYIISTVTPGTNIGTLEQCIERQAEIVIDSSPLPPSSITGIEINDYDLKQNEVSCIGANSLIDLRKNLAKELYNRLFAQSGLQLGLKEIYKIAREIL